ncbi:hypothetical protein [Pseudomonas sp. D(2018)]|uniref:hypothetical protein n=1 Tax=Pseudomonas sp. D(2018) TaxID=2502238 RepID=UPI001484D5F2|nr:hypothetical protein [Pseudomonas sp. D(2018)]
MGTPDAGGPCCGRLRSEIGSAVRIVRGSGVRGLKTKSPSTWLRLFDGINGARDGIELMATDGDIAASLAGGLNSYSHSYSHFAALLQPAPFPHSSLLVFRILKSRNLAASELPELVVSPPWRECHSVAFSALSAGSGSLARWENPTSVAPCFDAGLSDIK